MTEEITGTAETTLQTGYGLKTPTQVTVHAKFQFPGPVRMAYWTTLDSVRINPLKEWKPQLRQVADTACKKDATDKYNARHI